MNFNLFLIILIALILIFCIILYNGIRIFLAVGKEKGMVKYEFKVTILKIPIFKRAGNEGIIDIIRSNPDEDSEEAEEDDSKSKDKNAKSEEKSSKSEDKAQTGKSSKDKAEDDKTSEPEEEEEEKSKRELKAYLNKLLKAINLKKLEGHLILGLSDHTTTVKIASWIWSIGAIVNSKKPTLLTVEPRFNEVIIDFEGILELKINLLLIIIYSLLLLTEKNIIELIKELYRQKKAKDKGNEEEEEAVKEQEPTIVEEEVVNESENN